MMKRFPFLFMFFISLFAVSQSNSTLNIENTKEAATSKQILDSLNHNDGPYIFIDKDNLIEKNIINNRVEIKTARFNTINTEFKADQSIYHNVSKIAVISDTHGQYDLTLKILKNNNIIDDKLNWAFGKGHLVIVGDIFDRGAKVTELLWFVYNLENQALNNGGKVHFILGNHEVMVMQNDLRYINKKYWLTSKLLEMPYNELYGKETVLGRWLRSKPTVLKIDDNLFLHAGISEEFISSDFDLEETNKQMRQSLIEDNNEPKWHSLYDKYYDNNGPIWYRGYFSEDFKKKDLNKLLRKLDVKHIIVGHTSQKQIESLFKNKILAVDSSIKNGLYGEILFIENGKYYRHTMDGEITKLD
jgi:UDP-2,3-diacylglucosamine pyrophosphatase LpxH